MSIESLKFEQIVLFSDYEIHLSFYKNRTLIIRHTCEETCFLLNYAHKFKAFQFLDKIKRGVRREKCELTEYISSALGHCTLTSGSGGRLLAPEEP